MAKDQKQSNGWVRVSRVIVAIGFVLGMIVSVVLAYGRLQTDIKLNAKDIKTMQSAVGERNATLKEMSTSLNVIDKRLTRIEDTLGREK